jgi:hypothetical protein
MILIQRVFLSFRSSSRGVPTLHSPCRTLLALLEACADERGRAVEHIASSPVAVGVRGHQLTFPKGPRQAHLGGQTKSVFRRADCSHLRF